MELVGVRNRIRVINNSMCTNPAAVIRSSESIPARQHLLLGGSNKKLDFTPLTGFLAESGNAAYLFGRDAKDLNRQLGDCCPVFETMEEAFQAAVRNAIPGEVVMLAPGCASMDQFRDFEDRGNVFKRIAKEWLES
jgi:UDP-N-acetylmuramoylalanine--D-glutamate ligase